MQQGEAEAAAALHLDGYTYTLVPDNCKEGIHGMSCSIQALLKLTRSSLVE